MIPRPAGRTYQFINYINHAKNIIDSDDEHQIRFSALLMRLALEDLVYQELFFYRKFLPDDYFNENWRPEKLIKNFQSIARSSYRGVEVKMFMINNEDDRASALPRLTLVNMGLCYREVNRLYQALSSFLHHRTHAQPDFAPEACKRKVLDAIRFTEPYCEDNVWFGTGDADPNGPRKVQITCKHCEAKMIRFLALLIKEKKLKCDKPDCGRTFAFDYDAASESYKLSQLDFGVRFSCQSCEFVHNINYAQMMNISRGDFFNCQNCHTPHRVLLHYDFVQQNQ